MRPYQMVAGKEYQHANNPGVRYRCLYADEWIAVIRDEIGNHESLSVRFGSWMHYSELPPPVYFSDLKVGERFRWLKTKNCGNAVCLKVRMVSGRFHFINREYDEAWVPLSTGVIYSGHSDGQVERVV